MRIPNDEKIYKTIFFLITFLFYGLIPSFVYSNQKEMQPNSTIPSFSSGLEKTIAEEIQLRPFTDWLEIGKASLSWYLWTIYDSELASPDGRFNSDLYDISRHKGLQLTITYRSSVSAMTLLEATGEQWKHQGIAPETIEIWLEKMKRSWPDVQNGDRLIYLFINQQGIFFYQEKGRPVVELSRLSDPAQAKAFIDIWLSEKTAYPQLRSKLIGRK